jgi:ABC-type multidrug transport system ATPase subunit
MNAVKSFKNFTLEVDLNVSEGEKVLIQGPNGSGKTTLLYLIYGVLIPDKGYVNVFGKNPSVEMRRDEMYMLEEHLVFLENLKLRDNLEFIKSLRGFKDDLLMDLLKTFNLPMDKKPYQLSSGQTRLFKIALAFSSGARLLLLDEPTSNLDSRNSEVVKGLIEAYPWAVVFASHDPMLKEACNKVLYLRVGKVEKIEKVK